MQLEDEHIRQWESVLNESFPDSRAHFYFFVLEAMEYFGLGFHMMQCNVVCHYDLKGKQYNLLYFFPLKQTIAYAPKHILELAIEATGKTDAGEQFLSDLDPNQLMDDSGAANAHYCYLPIDFIEEREWEDALNAFLVALKGRNHEMSAEDFLLACEVKGIAELTPFDLMDFSSRYMDQLTYFSIRDLIHHPYGQRPDWLKVAPLVEEAYKTGKSLRINFSMHADLFPWPEGYNEDDPSKFGLQYKLVDR